jgi:hypothetical protein
MYSGKIAVPPGGGGIEKKVIGKFKDELNGIKILEYIGLRSKMCSYRT